MPIQTEQSAKRMKKHRKRIATYYYSHITRIIHTYVHTLERASNQANATHENKPKMFISQKSNLPTKPELLKRIQIKSPQSYTHTHTHTYHPHIPYLHTYHFPSHSNGKRQSLNRLFRAYAVFKKKTPKLLLGSACEIIRNESTHKC